jgi:hypothetical protein
MNSDRMSDEKIDAIGKMLSTIFIGLMTAMFAYAYLGHMLSQ